MVGAPRILVCDEATASFDAENERKVKKALDQVLAGRTAVVIAHRLSTVRHASIIYVFDAGRIVEYGDHESLIGKGESGAYFALVHRQLVEVEQLECHGGSAELARNQTLPSNSAGKSGPIGRRAKRRPKSARRSRGRNSRAAGSSTPIERQPLLSGVEEQQSIAEGTGRPKRKVGLRSSSTKTSEFA